MASEYLIKTVNGYEDYIKNHEIDGQVLNAYVMASQRTYCVNTESPEVDYHNGFIRQIYDEMYPITMPYMPNDKPDAIVCDELLTDRKNGDFDTIAILYIKRSDGEKVEVNRYFKWKENGFVEITGREYFQREIMDKQREEKEIEESYENC